MVKTKITNEYPKLENGTVLKCITGAWVVTNISVHRSPDGNNVTTVTIKNTETGEIDTQNADVLINTIVRGRAEVATW